MFWPPYFFSLFLICMLFSLQVSWLGIKSWCISLWVFFCIVFSWPDPSFSQKDGWCPDTFCCRGGSCVFSWGRGMGTQRVWAPRVFPNLMSMGMWEHIKRFYIQEMVKRPFDLIKKRDFRISLLEPTHQLTDNYFLRTQNHSSSVFNSNFFSILQKWWKFAETIAT
jgi:hypothetical protein